MEAKMNKRYSLNLPQELFESVEELADKQDTTSAELIRRFIRLGVVVNRPHTEITLKQYDEEINLLSI